MTHDIDYFKKQVEIKYAEYQMAILALENASESKLLQLPRDLFEKILDNLSVKDLCILSRVNHKFNNMYKKLRRQRLKTTRDNLDSIIHRQSFWESTQEIKILSICKQNYAWSLGFSPQNEKNFKRQISNKRYHLISMAQKELLKKILF